MLSRIAFPALSKIWYRSVITKVIPGVTDDMLSAMNSTGIISGYMEVGRVYTGKNILKNHWPIISIIVAVLISIVITVTR